MERNTRQKDLILEAIKNNRTHPTIYEICKLVQEIDPTIGQATIYRNIKKFVENGKIYVVKTRNGVDRYDYYNRHLHFECLQCGKIIDIEDSDLFSELEKKAKTRMEKITDYKISLEGYCGECRGENEKVSL